MWARKMFAVIVPKTRALLASKRRILKWSVLCAVPVLLALSVIKLRPAWVTQWVTEVRNRLVLWTSPGEDAAAPELRLEIPQGVLDHLKDIYGHYESGVAGGWAYYRANNTWQPARLWWDGKRYDVRIRSHGTQPDYHRIGRYISLGVRMRDGSLLFGVSQFRLVIYERVRNRADLIKVHAQKLGLPVREFHQLVSVKINSWSPKLFFIEKRLDESAARAVGRSHWTRFGSEESFWIESQARDYNPEDRGVIEPERRTQLLETVTRQIDTVLEGEIGANISDEGRASIKEHLVEMNERILSRDAHDIERFVDKNYIASFEAARLLPAYIGHGFTGGTNFPVYYDLSLGKVFPIIHRDNFIGKLPDDFGFEHSIATMGGFSMSKNLAGTREESLNFLQWFSLNDDIRLEKYRRAYALLNDETYLSAMRAIDDHHAHLGGLAWRFAEGLKDWLASAWGRGHSQPAWVSHSFNRLRHVLETAKVDSIWSKDLAHQVVRLEVRADSMAPLALDHLRVKFDRSVSARAQIKFTDHGDPGRNFVTELESFAPSDSLELSGALSSALFFNRLDGYSDPVRGVRTIEVRVVTERPLNRLDLEVGYKNTLNGQALGSSEQILTESQTPPPFEKWSESIEKNRLSVTQVVSPGLHLVRGDWEVPQGQTLVLEAGAELRFEAGKSLVVHGGLEVRGTKARPVVIAPKNAALPMGGVVVLGSEQASAARTVVRSLRLSGTQGAWFKGAKIEAGLSFLNVQKVLMEDLVLQNRSARRGLVIEGGEFEMTNSLLTGGQGVQLTVERARGVVENSTFSFNAASLGTGLEVRAGAEVRLNGSKVAHAPDVCAWVHHGGLLALQEASLVDCPRALEASEGGRLFVGRVGIEKSADGVVLLRKSGDSDGAQLIWINPLAQDLKWVQTDPYSIPRKWSPEHYDKDFWDHSSLDLLWQKGIKEGVSAKRETQYTFKTR